MNQYHPTMYMIGLNAPVVYGSRTPIAWGKLRFRSHTLAGIQAIINSVQIVPAGDAFRLVINGEGVEKGNPTYSTMALAQLHRNNLIPFPLNKMKPTKPLQREGRRPRYESESLFQPT
jgi:hypothetical protein